ncbi:MAG TPA: hypothetical protein VK950_00540 [Methylophilus sp.]|nr:hypothetical protein [Methylophilus sp.]
MKKILILIPLLLTACASLQPTPQTTSNGKDGFKLTCSEFNTTVEQCKVKASELCSHGYDIDKHMTYRETFPDSGDGIYMPARNHVVVACKES